jgi:fatty acid desaturase
MGKRIIERRRRGFFGWIMLLVFWLANGFMALWLFSAMGEWGKMAKPTSEAEKAGAGLGIAVGLGVIFSIWACVAIITGLFAYMTRGPKEIIEVQT